ncbi:hypothetical protein [Rhodovulum sp. P5]|uniref:hypothetical protein n=1 Tax=Rhodovulum sp. P5 TaxID=1564506 RepID=UPI0009D9F261|nr:hypothetical protein [Rhodovulum sp. P5]
MKILDFIWPHVGKVPPDETLTGELESIAAASWGENTATFLDEARRLRDVETGRKNAVETKSQIYLAALLALIPILVSLTENATLKGIMAFDTWYRIVGFVLFILGLAYGIGAFVSSFRALTVRAFHRVDVGEIVNSGTREDPLADLTKEILKSVRQDRQNVNHKVSYVIVTHQLLFRMALLLLLALGLITFASPASDLFEAVKSALCG